MVEKIKEKESAVGVVPAAVPSKMASDGKKTFVGFIKKNFYYFLVVVISVLFIIKGLTTLELTHRSVLEVLGDCVLSIVFAVMISNLFRCAGLRAGEQSEEYKNALEEYRNEAEKAGKHINDLPKWCEEYSKNAYKAQMSSLLLPTCLTYEQFVNGEYDEEKMSDFQKSVLKRAKDTEMTVLTAESLMSGDLDDDKPKGKKKATKSGFLTSTALSDVVLKAVFSVLFGVFTLPPITEWDWASAVWACLQVAVFIAAGLIAYFDAQNFVNESLREKIVDKTTKLKQFNVKENKDV